MSLPASSRRCRNRRQPSHRGGLRDGDLTAELIARGDTSRRARRCTRAGDAVWPRLVRRDLPPARPARRRSIGTRTTASQIAADSIVCELRGPARSIVTGERTALNFLQTLSGPRPRRARSSSSSPARARASSTRARRCRACGSRRSTPYAAAAARTIVSACSTPC